MGKWFERKKETVIGIVFATANEISAIYIKKGSTIKASTLMDLN